MQLPPTTHELTWTDLAAHSNHTFTLYGGEPLWVRTVNDREPGEPWVVVQVANVKLSGRLSTMRSLADALQRILASAADAIEERRTTHDQTPFDLPVPDHPVLATTLRSPARAPVAASDVPWWPPPDTEVGPTAEPQGLPVIVDGLPGQIFYSGAPFQSDRVVILFDPPHPRWSHQFATKYFEFTAPGVLRWGHDLEEMAITHR